MGSPPNRLSAKIEVSPDLVDEIWDLGDLVNRSRIDNLLFDAIILPLSDRL
jgi:hypothetical protein